MDFEGNIRARRTQLGIGRYRNDDRVTDPRDIHGDKVRLLVVQLAPQVGNHSSILAFTIGRAAT